MNDQVIESPKLTRRLTDGALLTVALFAVAAWIWRRVRRAASVDAAPSTAQADFLNEKVEGTVGSPPNNAAV